MTFENKHCKVLHMRIYLLKVFGLSWNSTFNNGIFFVSNFREHDIAVLVYNTEIVASELYRGHHSSHSWRIITINYRQTSNIKRTLVGNEIVNHSDVIGASPLGAAPTTYSFSTQHMARMDWAKTIVGRDEKHLSFGIWRAY